MRYLKNAPKRPLRFWCLIFLARVAGPSKLQFFSKIFQKTKKSDFFVFRFLSAPFFAKIAQIAIFALFRHFFCTVGLFWGFFCYFFLIQNRLSIDTLQNYRKKTIFRLEYEPRFFFSIFLDFFIDFSNWTILGSEVSNKNTKISLKISTFAYFFHFLPLSRIRIFEIDHFWILNLKFWPIFYDF